MRIAVIGASGMLGQHTARAVVAAGHDLVTVYRNARSLARMDGLPGERRQADLNDRAALHAALVDVDAVINCAAYYPTTPRPWRAEVATALAQMENFYAACAGLPLRRIVYVGAAIALPREPQGRPGTERLRYEGRPATRNAYLQVKWALDEQAQRQARAGLPVCIGIPAMTFGEFDPGNTTGRLIRLMALRALPRVVDGRRNVIYAGDAGRGLVRICEAGRVGERYLLTGENLTIPQLMAKISAASGADLPTVVPVGLARAAAAMQAFRYRWLRGPVPKISAAAIAVMSAGQFLDGSKARDELGFVSEVTVDEAIRRALAWFRKLDQESADSVA